jgi:4-amino-4-deoxy-L-arabinose transferase-like glycosyltransferase
MSATKIIAHSPGLPPRYALAILALATTACLGPFLGKAFCIDDPLFLWAGRQIQQHPLDFFGFDVNWAGYSEPMYANTKNPPLGCYYIALAASLVGWSEPALHAAFLLPAIGAICGTWNVARSLCGQPLAAALCTLATPVFLVSSTNVMCDTLALCAFVWAIALWLKGLDSNRVVWLVLSAMLVAASSLTKYFGVSLIPLLTAYTLLRDRRAARVLLVLLLPMAILAAYEGWTYHRYGRGLLLDAVVFAPYVRGQIMKHPLWQQSLSLLCFSGGCLLPAVFASPWLVPKRWFAVGGTLAAVVAVGLCTTTPGTIRAFERSSQFHGEMCAQIGLMCAFGLFVLWLPIADFWRTRDPDSALLALWFLGTAFFAGYVNWTCNGRSILPMAPVTGILLARRIELRFPAGHARRSRWRWSLIPAVAVALLVVWSDDRLAESARTAATRIVEFARRRERPLRLQGHWGFQWYMEAAGATSVDFHNPQLKTRDLLAIPNPRKSNATRIPPVTSATMIQTLDVPSCSWLTTLDVDAAAGFYASAYGPMPFVFGSFPPEFYSLFEILDDGVFVEEQTPDSPKRDAASQAPQ